MKRRNLYSYILSGSLLFGACSLDELNPSGITVDKVAENKAGFEKLINSCYFDLPRYFYGRNLLLVTEGGTDLWTADLNSNNNQNYLKYASGGAMSLDMAKDYWNGAYDAINYCNLVIDRVGQVTDFASDEERNAKVAEAHFLRALYYFHVVEQFGASPLTLHETTEANTESVRVAPLEIYEKAILPDLRFAADNLPTIAAIAGKPSKKSALGLLARACLQTKQYGADTYLEEALATARKLIEQGANYQTQLFANFADNFNAANNKRNTEALFQITYSQSYGSTNVYDHNNDFKRFYCYPTAFGAIQLAGFQTTIGRWSGGNFMPSAHLMSVFRNPDGTLDPRYNLSFQTSWTSNVNYNWGRDALVQYDRNSATVQEGSNLPNGALAIKIGRPEESDYATEKPTRLSKNYLWVDLADLYDVDNRVKMRYTRVNQQPGQVDNPFISFYPSLTKFNSGSLISPRTNSFTSDASATVMRLGEVYLIAAEAEFHLRGATGTAANFVNVLRQRVNGQQIAAGDITLQFLLDERARELCGEYSRWYDLKRTGKLTKAYLMEKNPDVGQYFVDAIHSVRPIPQGQIDAISNPGGYQNPGY
ncbi:RagB/SusD family nutrient uptake outer membrane protein [Sphingobacterium paludis]|uniref:Putative outer membrane starch-binding protein n=1 Tax=Sphingobacterium paludis TaxID=1476465 RepID=A0A4R7CTH2_9SPHI|nr:RagB/SusD family nutrient uptake outer membrane protein [Sphingobacterium paludis]TDS10314.1 putative outer membrane starch-binding protein [Sphingobacterium paludis]